MTDQLHLLPWLRGGLSTLYQSSGAQNDTLDISMTLSGTRADNTGADNHAFPVRAVRLLGPGSVVGLKPDEVLRRDPKPGATEVEPNYFASVELAAPDLPWRYTPGAADARGRLAPWLVLVVVEKREGTSLTGSISDRLQTLRIDNGALELPPLEDAWAWAHVQYRGALSGTPSDTATLRAAMTARSPDLRARLLCPRRLDPRKSYWACLVPAFESGRLAGLGSPGQTGAALAWDGGDASVTLPVYHSWSFKTGPRGDFEALVSRLTPREMPSTVGVRDIDVSAPGEALPNAQRLRVPYAGALVSPAANALLQQRAREQNDDETELQEEIARRVNAALGAAQAKNPTDPVVAPPAYGRGYQAHRKVDPKTDIAKSPWYDTLNARPEARAIAGVATELVRKNQDALIDMAWDAATEVRQANMHLNVSRVALQVGRVAKARLGNLGEAERMRIAAPAFDAMPGAGSARTIGAQLHNSAIPNGLFAGASRRVTRPRTGITTRGGGTAPGLDVITIFLKKPLGEIGRYRDVLAPVGVDPVITPGPELQPGTTSTDPGQVVLNRPDMTLRSRAPFDRPAGTNGLVAALDTAQNPDTQLSRSLRSRIPALSDEQAALPASMRLTPSFRQPVYQQLRAHSVEHLVPGVNEIAADTVTLLYPNPTFTRAFLIAMNHEMGREFLWREFPTSLSATWFRHFWSGNAPDIAPIADWEKDAPLPGTLSPDAQGEEIVLVVRGALPLRYPDMRLYALPATWKQIKTKTDEIVDYRDELEGGTPKLPHMAGQLAEDIFFFGFRLSAGSAAGSPVPGEDAGYFFAFEEVPTAPRFGLEAARDDAPFGQAPTTWDTISWNAVTPAAAAAPARFVRLGASAWMAAGGGPDGPGGTGFAEDAAAFARNTLQQPARVLMHASAMLPGYGDTR